jgi:AcrR family transcriptional regulator
LDSDERRARLLDLGRALFTQHPYDELSMAAIARAAGISKALLYHYFPSKREFFVATLQDAAAQLARRMQPDPAAPAAEQLATALSAWLAWVDANRDVYARLARGATSAPEVRELVDDVRERTAALILGRLWDGGAPPPRLRAAVHGWLWFMDGACLDWVQHADLEREELHGLLVRGLGGLLAAAGHDEAVARLAR